MYGRAVFSPAAIRRHAQRKSRCKTATQGFTMMTKLAGAVRGVLIALAAASALAAHAAAEAPQSRFAEANGVKLHYLTAGRGPVVVLLHGYAQNSHMWRPLIVELAKSHTVIAPDLRGFGASAKPASGYDKKTMAQDVHALVASIGLTR
jgi:predicted alpha/beta-fold hydrolase